ncbi:site-specific DNA-methyltransferase [Paenibacillus glycanilyticus]|uniref:DNA methyltransferase n=1 Tax=Paenibacillus glycanilyticus TaxID=126569 RepID=UPI00203F6470|nr:DNA methyltransferase [Paenibacillus glycanilyticus]MCM3631144.1 site-specific DNA-methyltransferase [Paenibacillus glycanilyticus]
MLNTNSITKTIENDQLDCENIESIIETTGEADGTTVEAPFWRTEKSKGRNKSKAPGKNGIDLGERGIFDKRNNLNDLTGREWTFFLNSVLIQAYPPTIRDGKSFDLRKIHPSPKPPQLMRDIISFFTKGDQWILDPFVGVGGSLIGGSICETPRHGVGIDLNGVYLDAYQQACVAENLPIESTIQGDSLEVLASNNELLNREFSMIITDPPYADMMKKKKTGQKMKFYGKSDPSPYTDDQRDLGNLEYNDFLIRFRDIMQLAVNRLAVGKYAVVFCKDLQPKPGSPNILHADIINTLSTIPGLVYRGVKIWYDQANDLFPFGYPYAYVMHQMHQYILIFRKET